MKLSKKLKRKTPREQMSELGVEKFEKWCEKRKITVDLKTMQRT